MKYLATLACALALLIAWEVRQAPAPADAAARMAPLPRVSTAISGDQHVSPVLIDAILARPLFDPSRRPPAHESAHSPDTLPRLSGVILSGKQRLAIFAHTPKPLVVTVGDVVAGYTIMSVTPAGVTLLGVGGRRVLRPTFETGNASIAPFAAAAKPPGLAPQPAGKLSILDQVRNHPTVDTKVPAPPSLASMLARQNGGTKP